MISFVSRRMMATTIAGAGLCLALFPALTQGASKYEEEGDRWWSHIQVLADNKLEGRNTGSPGHRKAAEYIAAQFERYGLKPAGTQGYFQPAKFVVRQLDESKSSLTIIGPEGEHKIKLGDEANLGKAHDAVPHVDAGVVFVGNGLQIPEYNIDDLKGVDLKGKIAVVLSGAPASVPGPLASHTQSSERWRKLKAMGAIGTAVISNPKTSDVPWERSTLARLQPSMSLADPALNVESAGSEISIIINPKFADLWFAGTGHTAQELMDLADANKPLPKFPLKVRVRADQSVTTSPIVSDNVAAVLPGSDPVLKNEYVVISGHFDHLGVGKVPINGDKIYNGAMDNASGTASILEMARLLSTMKNKPKRSILFLTVTGEEKGLLGSKYFANNPTVPKSQIVADVNLDMFLPLYPLHSIVVYGLEESDLGDLARQVGSEMHLDIVNDREPKRNIFTRSDQYNFIKQGVPALSFKFDAQPGTDEERISKEWLRNRYHGPSDDLQQPVDKAAAAKFNEFAMNLLEKIANRQQRPEWKEKSFFRRFAQTPGKKPA